jgi:flavin reductase (DIM6/NTAB) family NADH-FMN oxidoreductase RutF
MDPKTKREALRLLTNGMYVLTSRSGDRFGASTVTWASQASFKPPLLMAAIRRDSNVLRCMKESGVAVLHVLDRSQKTIAQKFFSTTKRAGDRLNGETYTTGKTSAPILQNLPAYLECKVTDIRDEYGDHAVVILEVVDAQLRKHVKPLVVADSPWRYGG